MVKKLFKTLRGGKMNTIYTYKDNTVILNHNGNIITTFSNLEEFGSFQKDILKDFNYGNS